MTSTLLEGMSMPTVRDILTHPNDLLFVILKKDGEENYGFTIDCGPEDYFKVLFQNGYFAKNKKEVIDVLGNFLEAGREAVIKELGGMHGHISACSDQDISDSQSTRIMSPYMIARILEELTEHNIASTFIMEGFME